MARLARLGVELRADGVRLRYRPVAAVDPGLRDELARHKAEILATLAARGDPAPAPVIPCRQPDEWDEADLAAVEATLGLRETWRPRSPPTADGIPDGWTAEGWIRRLRYLADACESNRPDLAARHRAEAQRIGDIENVPF
ncbi:MAG: hypothetical protein HS101_17070 [Planctomycetia bacterium]|nr:hypothetical protein [Planctomycetia bacterium]